MALGEQYQNNGKLFFLKVVTQDADKKKLDAPVFQVTHKEDGKYVIADNTNAVSGFISKIEIKEGEWEGNKYQTVSVTLRDNVKDEAYIVDFKMNMMNRSIFNALLNSDLSKEIKIGLYMSKKGYPAASVRQGENLINWKYSLDEIPAPEEVKFKGKVQRDYTATDEFFVNKLKELGASLGKAPVSTVQKSKEVKEVKSKKVDKVVEPDLGDELVSEEDIPF